MKKTLFILSSIIIGGCASTALITPTQTDVDRVASSGKSYTLDEVQKGKLLFENNCGSCHGLKNPQKFTETDWNEIVPRMVTKVNKKGEVLTAAQEELILKYVVTMSSHPAE